MTSEPNGEGYINCPKFEDKQYINYADREGERVNEIQNNSKRHIWEPHCALRDISSYSDIHALRT